MTGVKYQQMTIGADVDGNLVMAPLQYRGPGYSTAFPCDYNGRALEWSPAQGVFVPRV